MKVSYAVRITTEQINGIWWLKDEGITISDHKTQQEAYAAADDYIKECEDGEKVDRALKGAIHDLAYCLKITEREAREKIKHTTALW